MSTNWKPAALEKVWRVFDGRIIAVESTDACGIVRSVRREEPEARERELFPRDKQKRYGL